ncbi:Crp/Fnr family transcriptional regulator [Parahaliea mediterranea]|uniref:Crp/Fnr family transcriptional regulator n=1 Tax=Parahaliea mediterranea TaxID=651086 RepID=A0A939DE32_9GAMM|nr:Crp/Fnr family transcriptional regulator [Parahaliea mediterranea]MBN7796196.1 Crp/Fnr family transcriptional regulator [Parahaliea mediterranea]
MSNTTVHSLDHLRQWLRQQGLSRPAALEAWLAHCQPRQLQRDEFLLRAGDERHLLYFVDSGLLRLFYTTPDGKERNKAFYSAPHMVGAVSAAMTGSPAPFSMQALEPTTVLAVPFAPLREAAQADIDVAQLLIRLLSEAFMRNEQREAMLLTGNARQRYEWLREREPELLARLPQHHIASYIGVDAVSLSRLKRK